MLILHNCLQGSTIPKAEIYLIGLFKYLATTFLQHKQVYAMCKPSNNGVKNNLSQLLQIHLPINLFKTYWSQCM